VVEKTPKKSTKKLTQDALGHSRNLLLALSRAAQSIQRARTAEEVYYAVGDQIKSLGGEVSLLMVTDDRQSLTVVHTSYAPELVRRVEKLIGDSVIGYHFTLDPNGKNTRNIATGKTVYAPSTRNYVATKLPKAPHLLVDQLISILKIEQGIFSPLCVDDETLGLMIVSGLSLSEDDVPAMESLAGQIATSLSNVRLVQQMQNELFARKKAEENSLLQSAALEAAANAIAITDKNGTIQWVNPAWVKLTGYSKEESIGQNARLIKSEKHDASFYKAMWDTILAGKVWRGELVNRRKNGSLYYEEETITPVLDERGDVKNFIAIKLDVTERKQTEANLQHMARTDALTGVNNRRYLLELAGHEFDVARRYQQPLSVIMFDIDHFKQINDTFGHATGDLVLMRVTQTARDQLRDTDLIGRYGGEEFVIVLPVTGAQQAYLLAERIRTGVAALRVETGKDQAVVTLSIGVAETLHSPQDKSVEDVIRRADQVMYTAKQAGRNRTAIFDPDAAGAI
jgi:diguanylate cyclase (GGDEF)-like protein/PAS domain S-box-containing protein